MLFDWLESQDRVGVLYCPEETVSKIENQLGQRNFYSSSKVCRQGYDQEVCPSELFFGGCVFHVFKSSPEDQGTCTEASVLETKQGPEDTSLSAEFRSLWVQKLLVPCFGPENVTALTW